MIITNGGTLKCNMKGQLEDYGLVWYHPKAITNILSLACIVQRYLVSFNSTTDNNNFRFFTVLDDWATGQNYPFYEDAGYTIDSNLVNAMDGDFNFAFVGTDGTYTITIDTNNQTITLE